MSDRIDEYEREIESTRDAQAKRIAELEKEIAALHTKIMEAEVKFAFERKESDTHGRLLIDQLDRRDWRIKSLEDSLTNADIRCEAIRAKIAAGEKLANGLVIICQKCLAVDVEEAAAARAALAEGGGA